MILPNNTPGRAGWALGAFALFLLAQPAWAGGLKGNWGPALWVLGLLLAGFVVALVGGLVGLVKVASGRGSTAWGVVNLMGAGAWGLAATVFSRSFGTAFLILLIAQGTLGWVLITQKRRRAISQEEKLPS